jgi:hypothetical protein
LTSRPATELLCNNKATPSTIASYVDDLEMSLHAHGTYVEVSVEVIQNTLSSLPTIMEVLETSASTKLVVLQSLPQDMVGRSA